MLPTDWPGRSNTAAEVTGPKMENGAEDAASWRDRKRQATEDRIAACATRLFLDHGFEGTTVDAIAEAAGISRRSFFDYFSTKEDILFAWHGVLAPLIRLSVGAGPADGDPVAAARDALVEISDRYDRRVETLVIRLSGSSERVRAGRQMGLVRVEQALVDALRTRWPDRKDATRLAVIGMVSVGALRLALDRWVGDPAAGALRDHFGVVLAAIGPYASSQER